MSSFPDWDAELYARHSAHHRAYDDQLLGQLDILPSFDLLEIGSGSGALTAKLATLVPEGTVIGVDASLPLVSLAKDRLRHAGNVEVRHLRAQQLAELDAIDLAEGRRSGPPFDLAISAATLHWIPRADHPAVYRAIFELLRTGGRFRAEFGGKGQIREVRRVLDAIATDLGGSAEPWYFPDVDEVESPLLEAGFVFDGGFVRLVHQRRSLPGEASFTGWLDSQVLIAYQPSLSPESYEEFRRLALEQLLRRVRRSDGSFDQDYVRLDLLVTKAND